MKSILIFGGTGFIGHHLIELLKDEYKLTVLSRNPDKWKNHFKGLAEVMGYPEDASALAGAFEAVEGVINLAGENIGGGRWTPAFKEKILNSRISSIELITEAFQQAKKKPAFLIQGSATGYYGINPSDAEITESRPSTRDSFLTNVAFEQEELADQLKEITRLVLIRTGIVLDKNKGALPQIALPFKMFVGGRIGNGKQWIPWIHIHDEVEAIRFIIQNKNISGPVNLTAPVPVRQHEFARNLGKALGRPSMVPAPAFALKMLLGKEKAEDLLLSGLNVVPEKLLKSGFQFNFEQLETALKDIYL